MSARFRIVATLGVVLVLGLLWFAPPPAAPLARHALPEVLDRWLDTWEEETLVPFGEARLERGYETHRPLPEALLAPEQRRMRAIRTALDGHTAIFGHPRVITEPEGLLDAEEQARWLQKIQGWAANRPTLQITPAGHELRILYRSEPYPGSLHVEAPEDYPATFDAKAERLATPRDIRYELPTFWSLTPPFLVLLLALLTGKTIFSLFAGVLYGAMLHIGGPLGIPYFADEYVLERALLSSFRLEILGFVLLLSAAVGLMTRSGGLEGLVELVKRFARTARSSQLATWLMGLMVFFDDYANSIVVGSTMRPLTDRLRVSREKLAYIVDSTAAPIAGLVPLSTWVAYEISQFAEQLPGVTGPDGQPLAASDGFSVFVQTLPFRFYCFLTLFFVLMTVLLRREFGPMLHAERRARQMGKVIADDAEPLVSRRLTEAQPRPGAPRKARHAAVPILALVFVTIGTIFWTGWPQEAPEGGFFAFLRVVFEQANSTRAILLGSLAALLFAALLPLVEGASRALETLKTAWSSMFALSFAVVILILAWCIGYVCDDLGTKYFLVALTDGNIAPSLLPTLLFLVSCLIAFSTGSSWTTMAILLPNVVLVAHQLGSEHEIGGFVLMVLSIGAVLEGSIFGDHCSPISDTTVLSSVASASDHLHHVQTQAPYAFVVMGVSILFGYLPVALLTPAAWPLSMLLGAGVLVLLLRFAGRNPEAD